MEANQNTEQLVQQLVSLQEEIEHYKKNDVYQPHDCEDHTALRVRKFGGGSHYVFQCLECGQQKGQSLKKNDALSLNQGNEPLPFDETIIEDKSAKRQV